MIKPIPAAEIAAVSKRTSYPKPFADLVGGRIKRKLGDHFGLANFGVNLTTLEPGAISALHHEHSLQDELIYMLEGQATVVCADQTFPLRAGDCIGFKQATGIAHHVRNDSDAPATFLEIGDRTPADSVTYPNDDLAANLGPDGRYRFTHKNGEPY